MITYLWRLRHCRIEALIDEEPLTRSIGTMSSKLTALYLSSTSVRLQDVIYGESCCRI